MISYAKQCEVKKYIEGNLNVKVSFRPSALDIVADVQFPYGGMVHIMIDRAYMDDLEAFKIVLQIKIFEWWKELLKKND